MVWGESSGSAAAGRFGGYAYDLAIEELYTLGSVGLYQPQAAGRYLYFQENTGEGPFDIDAVVVEMPG